MIFYLFLTKSSKYDRYIRLRKYNKKLSNLSLHVDMLSKLVFEISIVLVFEIYVRTAQ